MSPRKTSSGDRFWNRPLGRGRSGGAEEDAPHPPFSPSLPRVDLLPAQVREEMAVGKTRRWIVIVAILVIVVGAGVWLLQGQRISEAESGMAQAEAQSAETQAKIAKLAPVSDLFAQIESQRALVQDTLAAQPKAAEVVEHLRRAAGEVDGPPVGLSTISVAYLPIPEPGAVLNTCPNPNPFDDTITIGCMTFGATAASRDQVSQLLRLLEEDPFFVGPYVGGTTVNGTGPGSVTFTGSAGVSIGALVKPLTPEELAAFAAPPAPAESSSPEAS